MPSRDTPLSRRLLVAALFWKGSTKWGALATTVWTAAAVVAVAIFQHSVPAPAPGPSTLVWSLAGTEVLSRTPGGTAVFGFMPVVPMVIVSALLMVGVSHNPGGPQTTRQHTKQRNGGGVKGKAVKGRVETIQGNQNCSPVSANPIPPLPAYTIPVPVKTLSKAIQPAVL